MRPCAARALPGAIPRAARNIEKQLAYEMDMIRQMGFVEYFLIVSDFIGYAKCHDIPVGPGRGSAAGSMVAYCLDITDVDPMKYSLYFERFLNPERVSMPDIDVDFCYPPPAARSSTMSTKNTAPTTWLKSSPSAPWPPRGPSGTWAGP